MRKKHKIIVWLAGLFIAVCLGGGGYMAHRNQVFQNEMIRIVHSKEARVLIEKKLKRMDPAALTDQGKIRTYRIDDKSIRHNPMGGIMFHVVINNDSDIVGKFGVQKYSQDGPIQTVGMSESEKLQKILEEQN